jgi:hypothetical protein
MDYFFIIYQEMVDEFYNDIKRRLEVCQSESDAYAVGRATNDFIAKELAQLKAQLLDVDLRLSQIAPTASIATLATSASFLPMPNVYAKNDIISIADPIATYGFQRVETLPDGSSFSWSGPTTSSGLIAHIDRTSALKASIYILGRIVPDIIITRAYVDGNPVSHVADEQWLHLDLPAISPGKEPLFTPTLLSFSVNKVIRPIDLDESSLDSRALGIAISKINLTELDPENETVG